MAWNRETAKIDLTPKQFRNELPRFWVSGGAGAWFVTEDSRNTAYAYVIGQDGIAEDPPIVKLSPFAELSAIEATRRGLVFVSGGQLFSATLSCEAPFEWTVSKSTADALVGKIVGLAKAPFGQFYCLLMCDGNVHLHIGSGIGSWRRLASCPIGSDEGSWSDMATSTTGDIVFWGGAIAGFYDAQASRLVLESCPPIATKSHNFAERMIGALKGEWSNWNRECPVMVALSDGQAGLLSVRSGSIEVSETGEQADSILCAVSVPGFAFARARNRAFRLSANSSGTIEKFAASVEEAKRAIALPSGSGVHFVLESQSELKVELIEQRTQTPAPQKVDTLPNSRNLSLAPTGFGPILTGAFGARKSPSSSVWLMTNPPNHYGSGPTHRIFKIGAL